LTVAIKIGLLCMGDLMNLSKPLASPAISTRPDRMALIRWCIYACFFLSGFTALVFEVLWSRQFVTVFGNSAYAISIVLCAYMAGLGLGGLVGGRLADRITQWMPVYGAVQAGIAIWALVIPLLLDRLRLLVPALTALSTDSLPVSTLTRFALSFAILLVPCFLMGTTLPLLVRAVTNSNQSIGTRVGALYCWNTLGAAFGCLAAGFWMIGALGLRLTNLVAVSDTFLVALATFALSRPLARAANPAPTNASSHEPMCRQAGQEPTSPAWRSGMFLLSVAFLNGLAGLSCEVLWFRYLIFLNGGAYVFPTILCVYLLGLGLGGLIYSFFARRIELSTKALGILEMLLAISVLVTFVTSALLFATGPPRPLELKGMAFITVFPPTVLMGMVFPLLCSVYGRQMQMLGQRIGLLFAVNTAGTVFGSLLPIFVLVPVLGIQMSLLLVSLLYGGMSLALLAFGGNGNRRLTLQMAVVYAVALLLFLTLVPSNLCQRVFLARDFNLARHTDILFYLEGRTGTSIVTRDRVNNCKTIYINGANEVPADYGDQICFKMLGDLGPMLHPNPDNVLMICFGGGIAAGAATRLPEVKSLTIVDLESSVVEAANLLVKENNLVLRNSKAHIVIDDGRNYLMGTQQRWPVIISDSTHPKFGDSWVLYTREFYQSVSNHLTEDGVFVEWVPMHELTTAEFKIIVRTFQSVFPHTSLWITHGMDANGRLAAYSLLVATPKPLSIDVAKLQDRLGAQPVRRDLEPYGLHTAAGFLDSFLCGENALQRWAGNVPVNTDDLPYTQYNTPYSEGANLDLAEFIEPMEGIWPCLTGTGSGESAKQLLEELSLRARINHLVFLGQMERAYALMPEDIRFRQMRLLYKQGPQYFQTLLNIYWNNPGVLVSLMKPINVTSENAPHMKLVYERVLELDPENVHALNALGTIQGFAGNQEAAKKYLMRAVQLDPGFALAHYNFGLLLESTGHHAEALKQWGMAAVNSDDPMVVDKWGVCLAQEGRGKEAIQWFNRAIELQPAFISARLHLGYLLAQMGRTQEAQHHVRYVLKMYPENEDALKILTEPPFQK
jgi:spermidine synthase